MKRDGRLMLLRGNALFEGAGLYAMGILCAFFQSSFLFDLSFHLFLILFALTKSLQGVLEEDYFYGLLDMIQVQRGEVLDVIWSKIIVSWGAIGGVFSFTSSMILMSDGMPFLKIWSVLMGVSFITALISLMMGSLVLGSRSLKSGLFIFSFPIYVPLILGARWGIEHASNENLIFLAIGALLFYAPLCFMVTRQALRAAISYK